LTKKTFINIFGEVFYHSKLKILVKIGVEGFYVPMNENNETNTVNFTLNDEDLISINDLSEQEFCEIMLIFEGKTSNFVSKSPKNVEITPKIESYLPQIRKNLNNDNKVFCPSIVQHITDTELLFYAEKIEFQLTKLFKNTQYTKKIYEEIYIKYCNTLNRKDLHQIDKLRMLNEINYKLDKQQIKQERVESANIKNEKNRPRKIFLKKVRNRLLWTTLIVVSIFVGSYYLKLKFNTSTAINYDSIIDVYCNKNKVKIWEFRRNIIKTELQNMQPHQYDSVININYLKSLEK